MLVSNIASKAHEHCVEKQRFSTVMQNDFALNNLVRLFLLWNYLCDHRLFICSSESRMRAPQRALIRHIHLWASPCVIFPFQPRITSGSLGSFCNMCFPEWMGRAAANACSGRWTEGLCAAAGDPPGARRQSPRAQGRGRLKPGHTHIMRRAQWEVNKGGALLILPLF